MNKKSAKNSTQDNTSDVAREYSMSLRLTRTEADRVKKITERTKQTISDFIRVAINTHLDQEELRIMEVDVKRKELTDRLKAK